ncbi:unnamed protein product [Discosporangium mesarthrocarpum]
MGEGGELAACGGVPTVVPSSNRGPWPWLQFPGPWVVSEDLVRVVRRSAHEWTRRRVRRLQSAMGWGVDEPPRQTLGIRGRVGNYFSPPRATSSSAQPSSRFSAGV